jgi:hypothetical protein
MIDTEEAQAALDDAIGNLTLADESMVELRRALSDLDKQLGQIEATPPPTEDERQAAIERAKDSLDAVYDWYQQGCPSRGDFLADELAQMYVTDVIALLKLLGVAVPFEP